MARLRVREYLGWDDVQQQLKGQPQDPVREDMLATWTEEARRRMPEAIRQAWTIVVTANPRNDIQAFRVTVGSDPLFATVKADRRARIQETAINAEALLPGGPYDLWRDDEPSRRVKDLASAFAEHPRLPKMLRVQEILATIDRGVQDGLFVASLPRPDRTVKTWWRTPVDDSFQGETLPAGVLTPAAALRAPLDPLPVQRLMADAVPDAWTSDEATVLALSVALAGRRAVPSPGRCCAARSTTRLRPVGWRRRPAATRGRATLPARRRWS